MRHWYCRLCRPTTLPLLRNQLRMRLDVLLLLQLFLLVSDDACLLRLHGDSLGPIITRWLLLLCCAALRGGLRLRGLVPNLPQLLLEVLNTVTKIGEQSKDVAKAIFRRGRRW